MEFLSKEFNSTHNLVNLINQTPESLKQGFDAAGTPGYRKYGLNFNPSDGYHEYRFDWTPDKITYYVDSKAVWNLTYSVPSANGHLVLNHWSNGDPLWSAGPPKSDSAFTVNYVKAYFNSSDANEEKKFSKACSKFDPAFVCEVPDNTAISDPTASQGAESTFLTSAASPSVHFSPILLITATLAAFFLVA